MRQQVRDAANSVESNIAEGADAGPTANFSIFSECPRVPCRSFSAVSLPRTISAGFVVFPLTSSSPTSSLCGK